MEKEINTRFRRIIFRKGNEYIPFKTDDIAYFYLENKVCFLVERNNATKHIVSKSLRDLEETLNPSDFYRINKKYIININAVQKFRLGVAGKVEVMLNPLPKEKVYISQLRVNDFKEWILNGKQFRYYPYADGNAFNQLENSMS